MNKVQEIHKSGLYGIIVETGCGVALTSALMNEVGASKTVYYSHQPYSKDYEETKYGDFPRSVSKAFVKRVVDKESSCCESDKVNFVIATSWQLNDGDSEKYAHGWYAVYYNNEVKCYHFSIPRTLNPSREHAFKIIGKIGVNLLYSLIEPNSAYDFEFALLDVADDNEFLISNLEKSPSDYPLVFSKEGAMRFEDLMRMGDEFIIQKGSFNPLHHQHIHMMNESGLVYPNAQQVFLISTYRYDKPHIDMADLLERINNITKRGYKVIVCKEVYFYVTFNILKRWSQSNKKFHFVVGTDTINRIYESDCNIVTKKHGGESNFATKIFIDGMVRIYSKQFNFLVLKRSGYELVPNIHWYDGMTTFIDNYIDDGTSSTKIRKGEIKNLID